MGKLRYDIASLFMYAGITYLYYLVYKDYTQDHDDVKDMFKKKEESMEEEAIRNYERYLESRRQTAAFAKRYNIPFDE